MNCINISHPDFKKLLAETGINSFMLETKISKWQEDNNTDNFPTKSQIIAQGEINMALKSVQALSTPKAEQLFKTLEKNKVTGDAFWKKIQELGIPKEQIELLKSFDKVATPDVILPIGTSGSGKSTFIKSLPQENLVVIEPDAMRVEFTGDMNDKSKDKEIYIEAAKRAVTAIKQGKQVVFDTTNLTKDKRLPFIESIKKELPNANIQYKLMELNPELAKQRIKADIAAGKNRANVPDSTIDRHAESYKQMLEDIKTEPISDFDNQKQTPNREELITQMLANYSYTVEINTAKIPSKDSNITQQNIFTVNGNNYELKYTSATGNQYFKNNNIVSEDEFIKANNEFISTPTQHYSNLTVPGGTNYTENEIATPAITPSIKGHAQFSTDNGIGWFRSDEQISGYGIEKGEKSSLFPLGLSKQTILTSTKTRRILEVQSDIFQKSRDIKTAEEMYDEMKKSGELIVDCG